MEALGALGGLAIIGLVLVATVFLIMLVLAPLTLYGIRNELKRTNELLTYSAGLQKHSNELIVYYAKLLTDQSKPPGPPTEHISDTIS